MAQQYVTRCDVTDTLLIWPHFINSYVNSPKHHPPGVAYLNTKT